MAALAERLTSRRNNVKIFTRIIPSIDFSHDNIKVDPNNMVINVRCLQDFSKNISLTQENLQSFWSFTTDGVFHNAGQEEIYKAVMSDVVDKVLSGINLIIMCYGQTGSGKSFTASGLRNQYEHRGLAPRLLAELFELKCTHEEDLSLHYKMSYVEAVRREMRDLLEESLEEPTKGRVRYVVKNALAIAIHSEEEALELMFKAESHQSICEGAPYASANLGSNILTINVEKKSLLDSQASTVRAKIHVVDLAGIDTAGKITSLWKIPRDIGRANLTKSVLQHLLNHLDSLGSERFSYPMIGYLGETLAKESILRLISHIRATDKDLDITLSTLRFGESASGMRCKKVKFSTLPKRDLEVQTKAADVAWLRGRVELAAMLENQTDWKQNNLPPYRMSQLHDMAHSYINNQVSDIKVRSVMENLTIMQDFKDMYSQAKLTKEGLEQKLEVLVEEAEMAREIALAETKERSLSKSSKGSTSSVTGSLGHHRGKKSSSKTLQVVDSVVVPVIETQVGVTKVGELKNWGITIGPGITSDYQGDATKASKRDLNTSNKLSTGQSGVTVRDTRTSSFASIQEHFRCAEEFSSDSESESKHVPPWSPKPMPPSRGEAWEEFLSSACEHVVEIEAIIEKARLDAEEAVKKHIQASLEMKDMYVKLNSVQHELLNEQHHRHLSGKEEYDSDGRIVVGKNERLLFGQYKQQEGEIALKGEGALQGLNELNECITRLNDAKMRLELKFQEFCAETYKINPTEVEARNEQLELSRPRDSIAEHRIKLFHSLQHTYFRTNNCKLPAIT